MVNIFDRRVLLPIFIILSLSLLAGAVNVSNIIQDNAPININNSNKLAKIYNEDLMDFDKDYRAQYLNDHKNFSNINFKKVVNREDAKFLVGSRNDNIKGFNVNNESFAIDLLGCNSYSKYCTFRINGVPTKHMYSIKDFPDRKTSFDLGGQYIMKIENIVFDFCDNRRFCHLGAEGYHVVDIMVEKK